MGCNFENKDTDDCDSRPMMQTICAYYIDEWKEKYKELMMDYDELN